MTATVDADVQEQARAVYRQSLAAELPVTGRQLGEMFDRSESWGRARIRETKDAARTAVPGTPELPHSVNVQVDEQPASRGDANRGVDLAPVVEAAETAAAAVPPAEGARAGEQPAGARAVVWVAFVLGIVASVAANIAHADAGTGPRLAAAFAPVALLLAVECMTRPVWYRAGWLWGLARYGGTGLVAVVAAVMSYRHMHGLLLSYGEDRVTAAIGPLAVDGLMVVAGFALLAMTPAGVTRSRPGRPGDVRGMGHPMGEPAGHPAGRTEA